MTPPESTFRSWSSTCPCASSFPKTAVFPTSSNCRSNPETGQDNQAVPDLAAPVPSHQVLDYPCVIFTGWTSPRKSAWHIPVVVEGKGRRRSPGRRPGSLPRHPGGSPVWPLAIPDKVVIDVTALEINQHVKGGRTLPCPRASRPSTRENFAVVGVVVPTEEPEEEAPAEEAATEAPAAEDSASTE